MKKIGEEIRFKQKAGFVQADLDIIDKNPSYAQLQKIEPQLKKLDIIISKIEEVLMADRKLNRTDVKNKIQTYKATRNQLNKSYDDIRFRLQRAELTKKPIQNQRGGHLQNQKLLDQLDGKNKNIEKDFIETADIIQKTKEQLGNQRQKLHNLEQQWQDADVQLTMIDQFMRMISNRTLLTKIILILLAIFLGFADIAILFFKIS